MPNGGYSRFDWGYLQMAVITSGKGVNLSARLANNDELMYFEKILQEIKKDPDGAAAATLIEAIYTGEPIHSDRAMTSGFA